MEVDPMKRARMEVDDEEKEALIIEGGWLAAVEILIQMADTLLASRLFAVSPSPTAHSRLRIVLARTPSFDTRLTPGFLRHCR